MSELKPCPFCGNNDPYYEGNSSHRYIRCRYCGCTTATVNVNNDNFNDSLSRAWNTRAETPIEAAAKAVDCTGIIGEINDILDKYAEILDTYPPGKAYINQLAALKAAVEEK